MNPRRYGLTTLLTLAAVLLALLTASACGGGSSNSGIPTPTLAATFTPATNNPAGEAVFMDAGARSGATFTIQVKAANITDLFGVAFRVIYDPTVVEYVSSSSGSSMLTGGGVQTDFSTAEAVPGTLFVTATRIQANPFVPGVDFTVPGELISLTFRATRATAGSSFSFSTQQVEICDEVSETCAASMAPLWSGGTLTVN
ncbi:MAG: hypothetical protein IFK94_13315 [Acidobacteria bacterium]|uniref:Cohesin domain-containing protein n=1 Tax=Candidatus Polarisedimenticola svalbardensis TaxID=2886004 RepID=A0A8J6Y8A8_9BACT|nr:hypothetical protein [Candidatus Polarisedimenticola svalbardensis]